MKKWQKLLLFYLSVGLVYKVTFLIAPAPEPLSREFWRDVFLLFAALELCAPFYTASLVSFVVEGVREWRALRAQEEPEVWTELVLEGEEPEPEHKPEPEKQKADQA